MDHLPTVIDPCESIRVPYLGGDAFDGLDFGGYPERQKWHVDRLLDGDLQGRSATAAAQFLQTWLYFGMLHNALSLVESDRISPDNFIRVDDASQQKFIWTHQLPELLKTWRRQVKQMQDTTAYYKRFRTCMKRSCGVWQDLMDTSGDRRTSCLLSHEVLLSIQILGAALDIGVTEVCGNMVDYVWRVIPRSTWLMRRMIRQGWCPSIVEQISKPCASFLYYASLLGPPRRGDDHSKCSSEDRACIATNVKAGEYVTKHVVEGCTCNQMVISTRDQSLVASAISRGDIPVVHLRVDGIELVVEVQTYKASEPIAYTAISHVWSDGLGNPEDNSLPQCQLKRLARLLTALPTYPETAETDTTMQPLRSTGDPAVVDCCFWMDTLCVPVHETDGHLRRQAIVKMRDIYKLASNVLVLSTELMASSCNRPYTEIFTRITCSAWLRRFWTLQEATLNRNLLFQFSERAIYAGSRSALFAAQKRDNVYKPWDLVAWECNRHVFNFLDIFPFYSNSERLNLIWYALANRITSHPEDEPLCMAMLLELDMVEFQKARNSDRVRKFWSLHVNGLPASILFLPGPKLVDEGFRWAPKDLMGLRIIGNDIDSHATVTPQGLCVSYSGFVLSELEYPPRCVIACKVDGETFFIRQSLRESTPPWENLPRKNLAVILLVVDGSGENGASGIDTALGVLVEVRNKRHENEEYVTYLRFVSVVKQGCYRDKHPNLPWSTTELDDKNQMPAVGVYLPNGTKWCVG